jgi:hypothetical protein
VNDVSESQGFDVVIGNPPYLGGREWKEENGNQYEYFIKNYEVAEYQFDIYSLFIEKTIKLTKEDGFISLITPNTWLNNQSNKKLRLFILTKSFIDRIVDYSRITVFKNAVVLPIISVLQKTSEVKQDSLFYEPLEDKLILKASMNQSTFLNDDLHIINIDLDKQDLMLREKIENNSTSLETIATVKFGIKLYETGKGTPPQKADYAKTHLYEADHKVDDSYRPFLEGKDIQHYEINWKNKWLKYGKNLAAPRDESLFIGNRILVRRIVGEKLICAFTNDNYVTSQLLQIVKPIDENLVFFLLAILNSKLMAYYFRKKYNRQDKTFPEIRIYELCSLPIKNLEQSEDLKQFNSLCMQLIAVKEKLKTTKTPTERTAIERQIQATDTQIDQLVYQLYGLTEEEIKIVEER